MKNIPLLLCSIVLVCSCVDKNPELDEEKYKQLQLTYENDKSSLETNKTEFFNTHKATIVHKIELFKKLKDSTNAFTGVNVDSTFYLKGVHIKTINFPRSFTHSSAEQFKQSLLGKRSVGTKNDGAEKAIFLPKQGNEFAENNFVESYSNLYGCDLAKIDSECANMSVERLQEFLDLKYAFIIQGYRMVEPSLEDSKNFTAGIFFATIVAYDLTTEKPILSFSSVATNSDEVSYRKGGYLNQKPTEIIKQDFEQSIKKELGKSCLKHFDVNL